MTPKNVVSYLQTPQLTNNVYKIPRVQIRLGVWETWYLVLLELEKKVSTYENQISVQQTRYLYNIEFLQSHMFEIFMKLVVICWILVPKNLIPLADI